MSEQCWPTREEIDAFLTDPRSIEKSLNFAFRFNAKYGPFPFAISSDPNLIDLDDTVILLLISTGIRTLAQRHGLGEALKKVEEVAYGRINGKRAFKMGGISTKQQVDGSLEVDGPLEYDEEESCDDCPF